MSSPRSFNVYVLFDFWISPFCVKIPTRRIRHVFHSQNSLYSILLVNHKYLLSNLRTERVWYTLAVLFANCTLITNKVSLLYNKTFHTHFSFFFYYRLVQTDVSAYREKPFVPTTNLLLNWTFYNTLHVCNITSNVTHL